jgi:hypothetical protein
MARRNVSARSNEAWSEVGRGKGLMKTMRSLGCADACWFRRSVLRGMVYAVGETKLGFEKERRLQKESLRLWVKRFPSPARYRPSASLLNRQSCLSRERVGKSWRKSEMASKAWQPKAREHMSVALVCITWRIWASQNAESLRTQKALG